ncbi:MAG: DUF4388 domain-containing protein [Acidobacteriota bacterium]
MSINGVLEDLPLADVLQFVHLGRRTGTLFMWRREDDSRAEIGFHDGRIVSAWTPGHRRLGDLLVEAELIRRGQLEEALVEQRRTGDRSIGQVLLDRGEIDRRDIHRVVREQVERTIYDLVTWRHGEFHFEVDELSPVDEFSLDPEEVLDDLDLNTQMLLLEATRIFDERNRAAEATGELERRLERAGMSGRGHGDAEATRDGSAETIRLPRRPGRAPREQRSDSGLEALRCQLVSADADLAGRLDAQLPDELVKVVQVRLREAGNRVPGESESPLTVLDLRGPDLDPKDIASLARTRPTAPTIALVSEGRQAEARRAGAVSVVQLSGDDLSPLVDAVRNLVRVFNHPQPQGTFGYAARGGFSRFRRVVFDVQSGLLSATMALNLMHVISESVERAVLFLVQDDELLACGAFGFSADRRPLAQVTRNLRLRLGDGAFRRALEHSKPQSLSFSDADLPAALAETVGPPVSGQVVIFPVLGAERPVSVIYTDNGEQDREIEDIRILELATSQVGVAFENELLRQRLGDLGLDSGLEDALPH